MRENWPNGPWCCMVQRLQQMMRRNDGWLQRMRLTRRTCMSNCEHHFTVQASNILSQIRVDGDVLRSSARNEDTMHRQKPAAAEAASAVTWTLIVAMLRNDRPRACSSICCIDTSKSEDLIRGLHEASLRHSSAFIWDLAFIRNPTFIIRRRRSISVGST